ncbi:MAG: 3-phosphoshikimate 1-carboxyvinyltransferase [Flavobacteriaceae bacterium]|nr:MAG: 3-phosphoshikimate 1-carboxyvinyltransferase [Flavobacteriaceae bacterium]
MENNTTKIAKLRPTASLVLNHTLSLAGSKSETNRALLLQALFEDRISEVRNQSVSDDSELMTKALLSSEETIDIHHAGTAMRFLTAYFSIKEGRSTILTGSPRMKERPIGVLVDALKSLGADITYLENEGFPPLKIQGKKLQGGTIQMPANISSQFISALMLIGGKLEEGLRIELVGKITSRTYLEMTVSMLKEVGFEVNFKGNTIEIQKADLQNQKTKVFEVESDWSSVSYYFSFVALSEKGSVLKIQTFKENSLQGDSAMVEIAEKYFGVKTTFEAASNQIKLEKVSHFVYPDFFELDMNLCPDIAQTASVMAGALKIRCKLTGLETLKIKETDRLVALQNELSKVGVKVEITDSTLEITGFDEVLRENLEKEKIAAPRIATYNDHRMAMAFAPLGMLFPIEIEDHMVVTKSYTQFWEDVEGLGCINLI